MPFASSASELQLKTLTIALSAHNMSKILILTMMILLGTGCSTSGQKRADPRLTADLATVAAIKGAGVGEVVSIDAASYTVVEQYTAASGNSCKKLQSSEGNVRAACQISGSGNWYIRQPLIDTRARQQSMQALNLQTRDEAVSDRSVRADSTLSTQFGSTESATPAASGVNVGESLIIVEESSEAISAASTGKTVKVEEGETLWKFSRRVTGNALNWSRIAEVNGIADVTTVKPGDWLIIPDELSAKGKGG